VLHAPRPADNTKLAFLNPSLLGRPTVSLDASASHGLVGDALRAAVRSVTDRSAVLVPLLPAGPTPPTAMSVTPSAQRPTPNVLSQANPSKTIGIISTVHAVGIGLSRAAGFHACAVHTTDIKERK